MKTPLRTPLAVLAAAIVLGGCPRGFDPAAAPAVKSDDPVAEQQFSSAQARFSGGAIKEADKAFVQFIASHPEDPLAPLAQVYRGRIALRDGQLSLAREHLRLPAGRAENDAVSLQARYYLGLTAVRQGSYEEGRRLLRPYLELTAPADQPPVLAALSLAAMKLNLTQEAARLLDQWHTLTTRPAERSLARQQLEGLVLAKLTSAQLTTLLDGADQGSLLAALCAGRLARMARSGGDPDGAAAMLRRTEAARQSHGVDQAAGEPGRIGLLVPLTGTFRVAGEQLLAGALEGAVQGQAAGVQLIVRDCGKDPAAAARRLLETERVSALVGTLSPKASAAVAREAAGHGAPFITTAPGAKTGSGATTLFRLFHPNKNRITALARHAFSVSGAKKLVILAPAHAFGRSMAREMARQAQALGAKVVANLSYPTGTHNFSDLARKVAKLNLDAVFVPDQARALALIAPALARESLWASKPTGSTKGKEPRRYLLLSTADGLSARELTTSARYLEGGVVAPGFFADAGAPTQGAIIQAMANSLGRAPTPLEAFARDGVALIGQLQASGALDRPGLLHAMRGAALPGGLTGPMTFDASGSRNSTSNLYQVKNRKVRLLPR